MYEIISNTRLRRRPAFGISLVFVMLLCLMGCAGSLATSQPLPQQSAFPKIPDEFVGIVYSLPKTVVAVTGKSVTGASGGTPSVAGSPETQADPNGPVNPAAPPGAGQSTADTKAVSQQYSITPVILPDRNARFLLSYKPGIMEDDVVTFETDSSGLLKTSNTNSTGHQGDIIVALAQTAAAIVSMGAGSPLPSVSGLGGAPGQAAPPGCTPVANFSAVYDLADLTSPLRLPDCSFIAIDWHPNPASAPVAGISSATCDYSVCYRTLMPVTATIFASVPASGQTPGKPIASASFVAVDPELTAGLNLQSAPLVTRTHTMAFSSGILTSAVVNDPSVALAVAKLPLTVITAILQAPASILSSKATNAQDAANLATQQKALLDAQVALAKDIATVKTQSEIPVTGSGAGN